MFCFLLYCHYLITITVIEYDDQVKFYETDLNAERVINLQLKVTANNDLFALFDTPFRLVKSSLAIGPIVALKCRCSDTLLVNQACAALKNFSLISLLVVCFLSQPSLSEFCSLLLWFFLFLWNFMFLRYKKWRIFFPSLSA